MSIGIARNKIINFDETATTPAIVFSPWSIRLSQIKSVIIVIPITLTNSFICNGSILNTEKMFNTFEIKIEISSEIKKKIKKEDVEREFFGEIDKCIR